MSTGDIKLVVWIEDVILQLAIFTIILIPIYLWCTSKTNGEIWPLHESPLMHRNEGMIWWDRNVDGNTALWECSVFLVVLKTLSEWRCHSWCRSALWSAAQCNPTFIGTTEEGQRGTAVFSQLSTEDLLSLAYSQSTRNIFIQLQLSSKWWTSCSCTCAAVQSFLSAVLW